MCEQVEVRDIFAFSQGGLIEARVAQEDVQRSKGSKREALDWVFPAFEKEKEKRCWTAFDYLFYTLLHHMQAFSHFQSHLKNVHWWTEEFIPFGMVEPWAALSWNTWSDRRVSRCAADRKAFPDSSGSPLWSSPNVSLPVWGWVKISNFLKNNCSYTYHFLRTYL